MLQVCGIVLIGLPESEMESGFNIKTLGERRRLGAALHRLANRQGFGKPGTLAWDTNQVCMWLDKEGLGQLKQGFRSQSVDGEVLLTLRREDLGCLGVTTMGGKATLIRKIEAAKKLHYAGQAIDAGEAGGGGAAGGSGSGSGGLSAEQQRLVLEQVLEENAELAARLTAARDAADTGGATAAPPDNFRCPITTEVMDDPVVAMDGHTYEREAIETWFRRHDTSPMTRAVIPPTLVPNVNLRSHIASWNE